MRTHRPALRRSRRTVTLVTGLALVSAGLVASSGPALAVHSLAMQLDGNTAVNAGSPAYDWESLFQAGTGGDITAKSTALPAGFVARGAVADYALPEFSTFATGSKDTLDVNGWQCGKSNNLGAKDDLVNVYTAAYRNPANDHLILYFGAEKSSNLGDNNIGIWFVQDKNVGCTLPASGKNTTFTGLHQNGDVLLTAAFTNGGTQATVESHAWKNGALGAAEGGFLCTPPPANPTNAQLAADTSACAITNLSEFSPPWNHPLKTAGANGALAVQEFYEGGVDVTQLEIDSGVSNTDPCISTFVADTRSSQSPTATLFDYALGSIPVCHPATTLTIERSPATMHSGDTVTWTAHEANTGTSPLTSVSVTDAASSGACSPFAAKLGDGSTTADSSHNIGDLNNNGKLDPAVGSGSGESWTFTCAQALTANRTINIYGSGVDTLPEPDQTVAGGPSSACTFDSAGKVTFQAANYVCDPNERASASVTVIHPSTTLANTLPTVSPATVHAGDNVTYVFYEKNDGDVALTSPRITTDDANCTSITTPTGGDLNTNGTLDVGEEWSFTCVTSYSGTGTQTIHAVGHGTDPLGADVTYYAVSGSDCTAGVVSTGRFCDLQERSSKSVLVINPSTYLRENASAVVTYTYYETNDGDSAISAVNVDSSCSAPGHASAVLKSGDTHNVGDANNDNLLNPGETWTFTCTKTVSIPSGSNTTTYTDSSTGHGTDAAGSTVDNTNDTDEADSSTVTVTNNAPN